MLVPPRRPGANLLLGVYLVVALGALTWPGYTWAGRLLEPRVLSLPFNFAWVVGWAVLTCLVLCAFEWTRREDDR